MHLKLPYNETVVDLKKNGVTDTQRVEEEITIDTNHHIQETTKAQTELKY